MDIVVYGLETAPVVAERLFESAQLQPVAEAA